MKAILATLGVVLAALALDAWLITTEPGADLLTPNVESVVQMFVTSLAANRPDQAHERLSERMRATVTRERLATLGRAWRVDHGRYRLADGQLERNGDRATYRARIETAERGIVGRTFALSRDRRTRLWQIEAFDGLAVTRRPAPAAPHHGTPGTGSGGA